MSDADQAHAVPEAVDGLRLMRAFFRLSPDARAALIEAVERQAGPEQLDGESGSAEPPFSA